MMAKTIKEEKEQEESIAEDQKPYAGQE